MRRGDRFRISQPDPESRKGQTNLRRTRWRLAAIAVSCLAALSVQASGSSSGLDAARSVVADAVAPLQQGAHSLTEPAQAIPRWFQARDELQDKVDALEKRNSRLTAELAANPVNRERLAEYDALAQSAEANDQELVPARVVGYGGSQAFSRTVVIDAGRSSGVRPDLTVVNYAGLVGRVIRAGEHSATVLLIVDPKSTVGGRLGSTHHLGFVTGRDVWGDNATLEMELLDEEVLPSRNDSVTTWGSKQGAPYIPGVALGEVESVYTMPGTTTRRAVVKPYVDFTALDVVAIAVPEGTESDRGTLRAQGGR